jgi:hypothetical protein
MTRMLGWPQTDAIAQPEKELTLVRSSSEFLVCLLASETNKALKCAGS